MGTSPGSPPAPQATRPDRRGAERTGYCGVGYCLKKPGVDRLANDFVKREQIKIGTWITPKAAHKIMIGSLAAAPDRDRVASARRGHDRRQAKRQSSQPERPTYKGDAALSLGQWRAPDTARQGLGRPLLSRHLGRDAGGAALLSEAVE
jgi:hypothetical protein